MSRSRHGQDTPGAEDIQRLVAAFRQNLQLLRQPETAETSFRQEYIDHFWTALGWDVSNRAHRPRHEREVRLESRVRTIEGAGQRMRRPDYLFRLDAVDRFIVEAKTPIVDVSRDRDAIFQAKTYAWSKQLSFTILTNFERFRLFDTTLQPRHHQPNRGLVTDFDLSFEEYVDQWDVIYQTFSREAVANGSLERLLAQIKNRRRDQPLRGIDQMLLDIRGTEPVDRVLLPRSVLATITR